jgi:hypothetical protein
MEIQTRDIGNYIIYSDGQIWTKKRKKFMKPWVNLRGYVQILIDRKLKYVHRLLAESFIPNPDNLPVIDHINNNKLDNRIENLRWCTQKQNTIWSMEDGLQPIFKGEENGYSKLTESDVIQIYENLEKLSQRELARKFNVGRYCIVAIQKNKTWTHITKDLSPGFRNKPGGKT